MDRQNLVLYRKYRPETFSKIIGQEHIVQTLTNAISEGMVPHAYLFSGPRGSGKTTIARLLAKAVNCQNRKEKDFEPCNKCSSCLEISQGRAIDLIEIDAASNRGIDEIRDLRDGIKFAPTKSKYKVFVIDECLTGDHFISMADGTVKKISKITNGDEILSINIDTGGIVKKSVSNWFKRKTNKIIEIKTPQTFLKVTPSHQLWVLRDGEFLLIKARDLKSGDFLLSPVYLPHVQTNNLTPEQLSLLAIIQCDGHVSKDSITTQIEIRKDKNYFKELIERGIKSWRIKEKPVVKTTSRGTMLIRIYSKKLKEVLINLGCPEGNKHSKIDIPEVIFQAPIESIKFYIDTCFCCEGNLDFNNSLNLYRFHFNSTSEIFTKKLQLLLKKFGISSNILEIHKERNNKKHSTQYRLTLSHYSLPIFQQKIGLFLPRKAKILQKCVLERERPDSIPIEKTVLKRRKEKGITYSKLASLGIYPDLRQHLTRKPVETFIKLGGLPELSRFLKYRYEKVKDIKIINKNEWVYDFTVEETHTFIVNGICSSNCHQLTKEAANALLKTLEEPPSHAIFVLATTEIHKMIPTIISRCQRFDFRKLTVPEIIKKLKFITQKEKVKIEERALNLIALNSEGSIRDAEGFLDQALTFSGNQRQKEIKTEDIRDLLGMVEMNLIGQFVDFLAEKNSQKAINFLNEVLEKGYDPREFMKTLINYLRQALLLKISANFQNPLIISLTKEEKERFKNQIEAFEEIDLRNLLNLFLEAQTKMRYSSIPQLPLELAIIEAINLKKDSK